MLTLNTNASFRVTFVAMTVTTARNTLCVRACIRDITGVARGTVFTRITSELRWAVALLNRLSHSRTKWYCGDVNVFSTQVHGNDSDRCSFTSILKKLFLHIKKHYFWTHATWRVTATQHTFPAFHQLGYTGKLEATRDLQFYNSDTALTHVSLDE